MAKSYRGGSHHASAGVTASRGRLPLLLVAGLLMLFSALLLGNYQQLVQRFPAALADIVLQQSFLPRLLVSLLCGGGLALAGLLFQQILRNPLAEPASLGVAAGANLAMSASLIFFPGLLVLGLPGVALIGAAAVALLLWLLASRAHFAPLSVILVGMVISLYGNALNTLLVLFNHDYLSDLFSWQAGALNQSGWQSAWLLLGVMPVAAVLSSLLTRPLTVLGVSENSASALGIRVATLRLLTLALAVAISAVITSQVGIISFIGLAAPALVRAAGVRRFSRQLFTTPCLGALLLATVDQLAQRFAVPAGEIPAGAVTALLSAPLLLVMLWRQRDNGHQPSLTPGEPLAVRNPRPAMVIMLLLLLLTLAGALLLNRLPPDASQWQLLHWRWPRITGALCAGAMLASAGVLIQRLTGNVMASPELLGVSSGAALMVTLSVMLTSQPLLTLYPAAFLGSGLAIGGLFFFGLRSRFSAQKMVLVGLALTSLTSACSMMVMLSGDPRAMMLLSWSTGSTAGITAPMAQLALVLLLILFPLTLLLQRWLTLLGLGRDTARSLGLGLQHSNLLILLLTALLTAAGTLLVGPLSFVGLIAPQLARTPGARNLHQQLLLAALTGGWLLVLADWLGRNIAWPWPLSAGLLTAFIGAPWFLWQWSRSRGNTQK